MELPLQITFRNIEAPPEVEQRIKEKTAWLDQFYPRIVGRRVLVDGSKLHRHQLRLVTVAEDYPGIPPVVEYSSYRSRIESAREL